MTDEDVTTALKQASLEAKKEFLEKNSSSPPEIAVSVVIQNPNFV